MRPVCMLLLASVSLAAATTSDRCLAQGAIVREAFEQLARASARFFGKSTLRQAGEELAEFGGEAMVRRAATRLVAEGGEATVSRAARLTGQYGPDVLRAVENVPDGKSILRVFDALDELPSDQAATAVRRLASGSSGRELVELVERYGAAALRTEVAHPGLGTWLVRYLGDDGIRLGQQLTSEQALVLARHADEIAALPAAQRQGVMNLLYQDTRRMVEFIGRFAEKNPGKTLFTAGVTTIILANPERVLGGDEIVFGPDGQPHLVSKPGLIGRTTQTVTEEVARPIMDGIVLPLGKVLLAGVAVFLFGWIAIKLRAIYRHTASRYPSAPINNRQSSSSASPSSSPRVASASEPLDETQNDASNATG